MPRRPPSRPPVGHRSPLRSRRRKKRVIVAAISLCVLALFAIGLHYVSYLQRLTIQGASVSGAKEMHPETITSYIDSLLDDGRYHFLSRRNIFLYPEKALERALVANFPRIQSATIFRDLPLSTALSVRIVERQPFAKWCESGDTPRCYLLDDHGFIFAVDEGTEQPAQAYIFGGGLALNDAASSSAPIGMTLAPGHLPGIVAMMNLLGNAGFTPQGARVDNDQDFFVTLQQGFFLKASYGADAAQLVRNLQLVLSADALAGKQGSLDYVDLRFGNRVYYKLKGEAESAAQ